MPACVSCRPSQKPLRVVVGRRLYEFESFAGALEALVPRCPDCGDFVLVCAERKGRCERCNRALVPPRLEGDRRRNPLAHVGEVAWESFGLTVGAPPPA